MNFEKRVNELRKFMQEKEIKGSIIFLPENQYYFSAFKAKSYTRPIVLIILENQIDLIIPGLEEEHVKADAQASNIYTYYEQPDKISKGQSFFDYLLTIISKFKKNSKIGVEFNTINYNFSKIVTDNNLQLVDIEAKIFEMRMVKDQDEIANIIEAGKLVSLALKGSLDKAREGVSELEIDQAGTQYLYPRIREKFNNVLLAPSKPMSPSGIDRSVRPHLESTTRKLEKEDICIHSRQLFFEYYGAECERTFFTGKPTDKQRRLFELMYESQQVAMNILKPGIKARKVDETARGIFKKAGLEKYFIHRTGHGIGLFKHERPYLRFDNELVLRDGMVVSIEPGIYIPKIGGFRHSDTLVVTKEGSKLITEYPRELKDLVF